MLGWESLLGTDQTETGLKVGKVIPARGLIVSVPTGVCANTFRVPEPMPSKDEINSARVKM